MALFTLIDETKIELAGGQRILKQNDVGLVLEAKTLVEKTRQDTTNYKKQVVKEMEQQAFQAQKEGFEKGLQSWANELKTINDEIIQARKEFEAAILSTAMAAAKKFVGRELEINRNTMVDIVCKSLKAVAQHKKIMIYCHKQDYDQLDQARPQLKKLFEQLEVLSVGVKENIQPGGYIIETERGIINHSDVTKVWNALEKAFAQILQSSGSALLKEEENVDSKEEDEED